MRKTFFKSFLKRLDPFYCHNQEFPSFTLVEEDGYGQRFVELEPDMEADFALSYLFQYGHSCCVYGDP